MQLKKTALSAAMATALGVSGMTATTTAVADSVSMSWSGVFTMVTPSGASGLKNPDTFQGAPYYGYRTPVSGTLTFDLATNSGTGTVVPFSFFDGGVAAATAITMQAIGNGSATTFTVVTVEGLTVRAYQIGDSEALVMGQRGRVRLQTTPHSPTGFAVEAGFLSQREALHHEDRHLVSNFLGMADMRIDIGAAVRLNPRDTVLLASDGLLDNVHVDEIIERVRKGPLQLAAERVITLAKRRMMDTSSAQPSKPDDLSLILFRKPYRLKSARQPEKASNPVT